MPSSSWKVAICVGVLAGVAIGGVIGAAQDGGSPPIDNVDLPAAPTWDGPIGTADEPRPVGPDVVASSQREPAPSTLVAPSVPGGASD